MQALAASGFVGVSLYIFEPAEAEAIAAVHPGVWAALSSHQLLVSVNSTGSRWSVWQEVLEKNPDLRLLVSHLGLPGKGDGSDGYDPTLDPLGALEHVLPLSRWPGPRVKLSGIVIFFFSVDFFLYYHFFFVNIMNMHVREGIQLVL